MSVNILTPVKPYVRYCTMCGKEFDRDILIVKDADLCPECRKTYGGMAFVYCNTCKKTISRVMPGRTTSGFLVKPGDLLHIQACPHCTPGLTDIVPEEQKAYEKSL